MDIFIARQPIFDLDQNVVAYEMLYRSDSQNGFDLNMDGDNATSNVLINTFQTFGISKLTNAKPAFINFTENFIKIETMEMFKFAK